MDNFKLKVIDELLQEEVLGWIYVPYKELQTLGLLKIEGTSKGDKYLKYLCPPNYREIAREYFAKEGLRHGKGFNIEIPHYTEDFDDALNLVATLKPSYPDKEFMLRTDSTGSDLVWVASWVEPGQPVSKVKMRYLCMTPAAAVCAWILDLLQIDEKRYLK